VIASSCRSNCHSPRLGSSWVGCQLILDARNLDFGLFSCLNPGTRSSLLRPASLWRIFNQAIATSVLNPNVALFFIAFLPQFANPAQGSVAWQIAFLGILFCTTGTTVNTSVALLSGSIGDWLTSRPHFFQIQQWFTGSVFLVLGTSLAFSRH